MMTVEDTLDRLMAQVNQRVAEMPAGSYTTQLIAGGVASMGAKITEEAAEVVEAAAELASAQAPTGSQDASNSAWLAAKNQLTYEACDLIYHLWVLLGAHGISVDDLRRELARREGTSGLEEKQRRQA